MTLRDEIASDAPDKGSPCSVCTWLDSRPKDEGWAEVMVDHSLTHQAIHRAMKRRGFERRSSKPVEKHRNDGHGTAGA